MLDVSVSPKVVVCRSVVVPIDPVDGVGGLSELGQVAELHLLGSCGHMGTRSISHDSQ